MNSLLTNPLARRIAIGVGGLVLLIVAVMLYGNAKYRAGVRDTDAKWQLASDRAIDKAATAADRATRLEAPKVAEHAAQVEAEKVKIDEAIASGNSSLDALFPVSVHP